MNQQFFPPLAKRKGGFCADLRKTMLAERGKMEEKETLEKIVQAKPSHCLLSQGLDDHTHIATLTKLIDLLPELKFIVAPSAYDKVASNIGNKYLPLRF